jgi:hypothetical protein
MNLFQKRPSVPTETPAPEPLTPLQIAEAELQAASQACSESSKKCERLDNELRYWRSAREAAAREHSQNCDRHAGAKDLWLRLSNPTPVKGGGTAQSFPVGAVLGD